MKSLLFFKIAYFLGFSVLILLTLSWSRMIAIVFALYCIFVPYPRKRRAQTEYEKSVFLSNFNILNSLRGLLHITGQLILDINMKADINHGEEYKNRIEYNLPFQGIWHAAGGVSPDASHSWHILNQRFAYDFVIANAEEITFSGGGKKLDDYYCFNQPILSPADGIVVKVNNHIRDYTGVGDHSIDWKTWDFRGNFVVIKHADKEFSFLAHLRKDSILVKKGDFVRAGQVIGLCGNSGHSTEPHLHFHLQNNRNFWFARGLPIVFKNAAVASKLNADFYPLTTHIDGECFVKTDQ
jgi:hypothetical protein